MGLDWRVAAKASPGHEDEVDHLRASLIGARGDDRKKLVDRFRELTVPAYVALGAPVIGRDPSADAWLLEQYRARSGSPSQESEAHRPRSAVERGEIQRFAGYHVIQLLPECDGFPVYSNAYMYASVDRTSFRAQFLQDCKSIIGEELLEIAYLHKSPDELVKYGETLIDAARNYAAEHNCVELEDQREPPKGDGISPSSCVHILFSAAKWCLYWGHRGYGLEPDF